MERTLRIFGSVCECVNVGNANPTFESVWPTEAIKFQGDFPCFERVTFDSMNETTHSTTLHTDAKAGPKKL